MPRSFTDYVYGRLLSEVENVGGATEAPAPGQDTVAERKQKIKNVQSGFAQAREELSKIVDAKFAELEDRLQRSFGSQQKVNSVDRKNVVQMLFKIADKINSWGEQDDVRYTSSAVGQVPIRVPPVAAEGICAVNELLVEAEVYVENNAHSMNIMSVKAYLKQVKDEIMQQVDNMLRALQNDAVMKMMNDIQKSVSTVHGIVIGQSPLNATEKIDAFHNLQQLGNTIGMSAPPKLKFGERLPKSTSPVQIILGGGHTLNFDPSDRNSIQTAMGKLRNPRAVKIKVGDRVETVDISNKQQMSDIISIAQELMNGQQLAAANKVAVQSNDPLWTARQSRKKVFPTPGKPTMPVALGPGVGE
jgi:hypothetical protein